MAVFARRFGWLLVGIILAAAACGSDSDSAPTETTGTPDTSRTAPETTSTTTTTTTTTTTSVPEPAEVVQEFYDAWSRGAVDAALGYLDADLESSVGPWASTAGYLEYLGALGVGISISDCSSTPTGLAVTVTCDYVLDHPVALALELDPPRAKHDVVAGVLTEINWRPTYQLADALLSSYALEIDPEGHAAACPDARSLTLKGLTVVYGSECGSYLAGHVEAAAAEILAEAAAGDERDPVRVVEDFYAAWGAGELDAAVAFLAPTLTSPAGGEPGPGLPRFRSYMDYIDTVPQNVSATDCSREGSSLVTCTVTYRDPVIEALGIAGASTLHEVKHGRLEHITLPSPYAQSDKVVASYLAANEPDEYAGACAIPPGGITWGEFGLAFNATCAEFVGRHLEAIAASL